MKTHKTRLTLNWLSAVAALSLWTDLNAAVSDGFDYPIGANPYYTKASDTDGWYDAQDFGDYYSVNGKYHLGEDWNAESGGNTDCGLPVYSASNGTVVFAGTGTGWGKVLIVRHQLPDGTFIETLYGHLQSLLVANGNTVTRRQQIGTVGNGDGAVASCHLHFEVRFSNCPNWGSPGPGYSTTPEPAGWTDPSDFVDSHRFYQNATIEAFNTASLTVRSPNACSASVGSKATGNTGTVLAGPVLCDTGTGPYNRYQIRWSDGLEGWSAQNWLKYTGSAPPPPANDQCAGATVIAAGSTYSVNTANATSTGDPAPSCRTSTGKGVWYSFTPSITGLVTISTCASSFDTVIAVYTGACGSLTAVSGGCNDDNGPSCAASTASVSFSGTAGTTYRILAGGYSGASGTLSIVATVAPQFPDLTIVEPVLVSPTSVTPGGTIQVDWTEKNQGTAASTPAHNTKIFLSTTAYGTTHEVGYYGPMNTLGVGATASYNGANIVVPTSIPAGDYYVTAFIDCDQNVSEGSNEGNNIGSSSATRLTVTPNNISVTVQPNPSGRSFTVDGTPYATSQTFTWVSGSSHTIATTSPQSGGTGIQYVWSNWSDGGAISHTVAPTGSTTYTANFTTQFYLTMNAGTGGTVSPSSGWYNGGAGVSISATANSGYSFSSWSGSGSGSYSGNSSASLVTMNAPITESAAFTQNPISVTVQPNPSGRSFSVDGTAYSTAQVFNWTPSSSHTIATTTPQSGGTGIQYIFSNWSDGGAMSHTVSPSSGTTYTANFTTQYYLTISAGTGGTVSPSSGWYNSGAGVSISATPNSGYNFSNWTGTGNGSYSGSSSSPSVTMNAPISQAAAFVSSALPQLGASRQGSNLMISWPTNDPAFKLFYTTNPSTMTWISNTVSPSIVNGRYTITNNMTNSFKLYRLKK